MANTEPTISVALAEEVVGLLGKLNRGNRYWESLYWEHQEDFTQLFVRISIADGQNNPENIQAVTCLLRSVLAPLLPTNEEKFTWCAAVVHEGDHVGGVMGGIRDDWKTLGMET